MRRMTRMQAIVLAIAVASYCFVLYAFLRSETRMMLAGFMVSSISQVLFSWLCFVPSKKEEEVDVWGDEAEEKATYAEAFMKREREKLNREGWKREYDEEYDEEYEDDFQTADLEGDEDGISSEEGMEPEELSVKELRAENVRLADMLAEKIEELEQREKECESLRAGETARMSSTILPALPEEGGRTMDIDISEVAKKAVLSFQEQARRVGVQIFISRPPTPLLVRANDTMIFTLFCNIIDNAVKYMKRQGSLIITISHIDEDIFVVLKDNGDGLPEDETRRIFELNYQGSNRISGNGLGLAQAKAIVSYYGGMIYAKSGIGKGMGIYIHIPASDEQEEE